MADPRARALTLAHRRDLARLTGLVGRQARAVAATADRAAVADWWARDAALRMERVVAAGHRAAVILGVRYLRVHAALSGATVDPVPARMDLEQVRGSLYVASVAAYMRALRVSRGSTVAASRVMTARLVASAHRLVLAGERDTVLGTFAAGR